MYKYYPTIFQLLKLRLILFLLEFLIISYQQPVIFCLIYILPLLVVFFFSSFFAYCINRNQYFAYTYFNSIYITFRYYHGEGNNNSLHYSCLENSMDRGVWWATVHGVAKSRTQLSAHTHTTPCM